MKEGKSDDHKRFGSERKRNQIKNLARKKDRLVKNHLLKRNQVRKKKIVKKKIE